MLVTNAKMVVGMSQLQYSSGAGILIDYDGVRNRTLTLIEREDDTRSWDNFLIYFSHSTTMSYPPRGLEIHTYRLLAS
jgi:hypothetical protein